MWKHLRSKHSLQMSMQSTQESGNGGNKEGQNEKNDTDEHSQVNIHTKKKFYGCDLHFQYIYLHFRAILRVLKISR